MTTLKEMCEQALKAHDADCFRLRDTHKEQDHEELCRAAMVSQIERAAKAFAEKAPWQMHGGLQSVIARSGGSAMFVETIAARIADAIAAADAPTKT